MPERDFVSFQAEPANSVLVLDPPSWPVFCHLTLDFPPFSGRIVVGRPALPRANNGSPNWQIRSAGMCPLAKTNNQEETCLAPLNGINISPRLGFSKSFPPRYTGTEPAVSRSDGNGQFPGFFSSVKRPLGPRERSH